MSPSLPPVSEHGKTGTPQGSPAESLGSPPRTSASAGSGGWIPQKEPRHGESNPRRPPFASAWELSDGGRSTGRGSDHPGHYVRPGDSKGMSEKHLKQLLFRSAVILWADGRVPSKPIASAKAVIKLEDQAGDDQWRQMAIAYGFGQSLGPSDPLSLSAASGSRTQPSHDGTR